jgi:hypothetical protein
MPLSITIIGWVLALMIFWGCAHQWKKPSDMFDSYRRRSGQAGFKDQNQAEQERRTHFAFRASTPAYSDRSAEGLTRHHDPPAPIPPRVGTAGIPRNR